MKVKDKNFFDQNNLNDHEEEISRLFDKLDFNFTDNTLKIISKELFGSNASHRRNQEKLLKWSEDKNEKVDENEYFKQFSIDKDETDNWDDEYTPESSNQKFSDESSNEILDSLQEIESKKQDSPYVREYLPWHIRKKKIVKKIFQPSSFINF